LASNTDVALSGGECLFTRYEFVPVFEMGAFDIVQPDAAGVGGISEAHRIGGMASAHGLDVVPHIACSSGTGVGLAANLQVIGSASNARFVEYDLYDDSPLQTGLLTEPPRAEEGFVELSEKPGLGIELDEGSLKRFLVE
jgi:L-alanine-DL-glutamate epimerase-like enolase superfamily enzyme